jgi:hypothetical protein
MNEANHEEGAAQGTLEERIALFRSLRLPGQPHSMHMGTAYLVEDLWREVRRLRALIQPLGPEMKCLEIRDANTFVPVICIRPVPRNDEQRYLLRRDGYSGNGHERCIIMIDAQCRGAAYDPYDWKDRRTKGHAHNYITEHWYELKDGDVIDVEFILGETKEKKVSERVSYPA